MIDSSTQNHFRQSIGWEGVEGSGRQSQSGIGRRCWSEELRRLSDWEDEEQGRWAFGWVGYTFGWLVGRLFYQEEGKALLV